MKEIYSEYREIIRYVIVGAATTAVSLGTYYLCTDVFIDARKPMELQFANVLSWIAAVTFSYFASRMYVFNSKNANLLQEGFHFYLARIGTLVIDMVSMFILVTGFHMNNRAAKLLVQIIILILNYIFSKVFVFSGKND